jgi:hypothetical protein
MPVLKRRRAHVHKQHAPQWEGGAARRKTVSSAQQGVQTSHRCQESKRENLIPYEPIHILLEESLKSLNQNKRNYPSNMID